MNETITALDFANSRENVVLRYASAGAPAGQDIALLGETDLPFDLEKIEGTVDKDGRFTATNLTNGHGAHDWSFTDWKSNYVIGLWLRVDAAKWQEEYEEWMIAGA